MPNSTNHIIRRMIEDIAYPAYITNSLGEYAEYNLKFCHFLGSTRLQIGHALQRNFTNLSFVYSDYPIQRSDFFQSDIFRSEENSVELSASGFRLTRIALVDINGLHLGHYGLIKIASDLAGPSASETTKLLTPRELEVLSLYSKGISAKEVAQLLLISRHTVVHHLRSSYGKLGVKNKSLALTKLQSLGW